MVDIQSNNKRIAKNTLMLYIRMFVSMAVSLYTSRVILQTLGVEDYGIYNVVGGVVAMFSFINSTLSTATSRFLTFEIGTGNMEKLKATFNASFWVHVVIALAVVLLCETVGLWFLMNKMVIPEERYLAAHIVFQFSVFATFISITQTPYNASLIAHEKMDVYAYVELVHVFLKLGILYVLLVISYDKLILYGFLVLCVSTGIAFFYRWYDIRYFGECHINRNIDIKIVKPMLSFSAWDFYGNMSVTARSQAVAMLLNVFFGPVMNAAAGIANSVQGAVMGFANNVTTAVRPQIVKYYAQGEYSAMSSLICNACRLNFFILLLIMAPLCGEINYILSVWLGEVPPYAAIFCVLTLLFNIFANMSFLIISGIEAYGKIIRPSLINGTLYLLVVPISYVCFKFGGDAWWSFAFNILAIILGLLSNAYTMHLYVKEFSVNYFISNVFVRCLLMLAVAFIVNVGIQNYFDESFTRLILTTIITTIVLGCVGWVVLLNKRVREMVLNIVKTKILKRR